LPPPELGEHTDEVLASVGYSPADIAALRQRGAV
jgi:crotonobetainyl-CoA:carnitine CoA-transferase CaiB-like acyl-CoA transferase